MERQDCGSCGELLAEEGGITVHAESQRIDAEYCNVIDICANCHDVLWHQFGLGPQWHTAEYCRREVADPISYPTMATGER